MSLSGKVRDALRHNGMSGLSRKAALFLSRRAEWRAGDWSKRLDYRIAAAAVERQYQHLLSRNSIFRNRHKGKPAFVIGNGPSINEQDLKPLAGELTFVTNAFCRHPILDHWQPAYYFLSDPEYFDESARAREFFAELAARVPRSTYFVPHTAHGKIERDALLQSEQTYYIAMAGNLADQLAWTPDFTRAFPGVRTVAQLAIIGAMVMGCSPIYLLGLDHDWLAHANSHQTFYTGQAHEWKYKDLMQAVLIMWRGYESIRDIATTNNIQIINATRGGFLDVFDRADYESVIS